MKKAVVLEFVVTLLVMLFVYTGVSKLIDMKGYQAAMHVQPFATWIKHLSYALPVVEIIVALGLVFERSRHFFLWCYVLLMLAFTVYMALVVFHFFKQVPCICGGVIKAMSWTQHLVFNLFFLLLSMIALWMHRRQKIFMHNKGVSRKPLTE
jgi:putative oxidoreductase